MKKALITGITGQDGSYLAELLLDKGYEVHGIIRRASTFNTERIEHLYQDPHVNKVRLFLHYGDIADSTNLIKLLYRLQPDEIYNEKPHRFTHAVPTARRSSMPIGSPSTTARAIGSSPATAFFSTMSLLAGGRHSSPGKSAAVSLTSRLGCRTSFTGAISTPRVTGAMRKSTWKPYGSCCGMRSQTTTSLPQGRDTW